MAFTPVRTAATLANPEENGKQYEVFIVDKFRAVRPQSGFQSCHLTLSAVKPVSSSVK